MQQVYGIMGEKRHGKDTFAKIVLRAADLAHVERSFRTTHFAKALKDMAGRIWGLSYEQLWGDEKETPLPCPVHMDEALSAMRQETGLDIKPTGMVAVSSREIMQYLGTEYVRATQDNYWIERLKEDVRQGGDVVLVPDTRFPNEADAIRAMGGKILKIVRADLMESGTDKHASEQEQAKIVPDVVVYTRTGDLSNATSIAKAVVAGFFYA